MSDLTRRPTYSRDAVLRAAGFEIAERKPGKEPKWRRRNGVAQTQTAALRMVAWELTNGTDAEVPQ